MWDRGQAKTVNVDPAVWRTFDIAQGEQEWDQLRKKGWRVFQKRIKDQATVRNEELLKRQYSIGAWFCVVERNFNIADKLLVSDLPPLAQNVVVSPYWTDEPETPVQVPDERRSPRAVELQKTRQNHCHPFYGQWYRPHILDVTYLGNSMFHIKTYFFV